MPSPSTGRSQRGEEGQGGRSGAHKHNSLSGRCEEKKEVKTVSQRGPHISKEFKTWEGATEGLLTRCLGVKCLVCPAHQMLQRLLNISFRTNAQDMVHVSWTINAGELMVHRFPLCPLWGPNPDVHPWNLDQGFWMGILIASDPAVTRDFSWILHLSHEEQWCLHN